MKSSESREFMDSNSFNDLSQISKSTKFCIIEHDFFNNFIILYKMDLRETF